MSAFKGTLIAAELPWMISPSVSDLRIKVVENGDAVVSAEVAVLPEKNPESAGLENKRVLITFKGGQWVSTEPAFADRETIPPELFEECPQVEFDGGKDYLIRFRRKWCSSGLCPDPRVYEVHNSVWSKEKNAARFGCRHYVVEGHDMWLQVIAKGFDWKLDGPSSAEFIDPTRLPVL